MRARHSHAHSSESTDRCNTGPRPDARCERPPCLTEARYCNCKSALLIKSTTTALGRHGLLSRSPPTPRFTDRVRRLKPGRRRHAVDARTAALVNSTASPHRRRAETPDPARRQPADVAARPRAPSWNHTDPHPYRCDRPSAPTGWLSDAAGGHGTAVTCRAFGSSKRSNDLAPDRSLPR